VVRTPAGTKDFLFSKSVDDCSSHTLLSIDTGYISRGERDRDVNLTTDLLLEPRVKMGGAISLLPLYAFKA
jgi:hypothetical protein